MSQKYDIEKLLQGMRGDINKITGKQDGDLTECINTLLNGYGQGGDTPVANNPQFMQVNSRQLFKFETIKSFNTWEVIE